MEKMNRTEYLGNVTHPDPTAEEAIGRATRSKYILPRWTADHPLTLEELIRERREKNITKREFWRLRAPLIRDYRDINQTNILQKGEKE